MRKERGADRGTDREDQHTCLKQVDSSVCVREEFGNL